MAGSRVCRARPRGRTGGRSQFRLGKPARRPDGRAGPGPCGPRTPSCPCSRLQGGGWSFGGPRLPLDLPFSPRGKLPLTDGVTSYTPFVRLNQSGPCSLQKTYTKKASVVKSPHKGTRCAHHGGWLGSSLWLHCLFSATVAPAGFGEGPSVQGCGHPSPENWRPATGCPFLQLAVPPLSAVPGTCPSCSLANNCVPEGRGRV